MSITAQVVGRKIGFANFEKSNCLLCHKLTAGLVDIKFSNGGVFTRSTCVSCMDKHDNKQLAEKIVNILFYLSDSSPKMAS